MGGLVKRVFKWSAAALSAALLVLAALVAHTIYFKPLKLDWFYTRLFAVFALQSPEQLSAMRILPGWMDFSSAKLDDATPAHEQKMADLARDALATLKRYDRNELDREGQLSYDTLNYFLQTQVDGEPFKLHDFPVNQLHGVQSALPDFLVQTHEVESKAEAENYITRLKLFPQKFSQLAEGLKLREARGIIPPRFMVEKVLVQMRGMIAQAPQQHVLYVSFKQKLDKIPAGEMDADTRKRLLFQVEAALGEQVYPAYRGLIAYFTTLQPKAQRNDGAWSLPNGDAYYAWCVRKHTTSAMTPQQVHDLGLAEVVRVSGEMDAILKLQGLSDGSVGARVQQLASRPEQQYPNTPAGKKDMLGRYQVILDEINQGIGRAFDIRPSLGVKVEQIPPASEATAPGAYYSEGSFDGSRPGIFYANMRNPGETPKFVMRTLAYHEGIPGHHFQVAIAQELSDVPFFRRVIGFTAYAEGWALYAERLASEQGYEKDELDNLGRLREEMLRSTRLVIDTGIHYKHWTREQAIGYMMENTGMQEGDATAEVERYIVDPGQALAYKTGMVRILAMREHAKQELGAKFDLKQFHNEVLSHGSLPLAVLERVIDDWIARRKQG
ncbi:hypothetical protein DUGA6_28180 [Duganella sp. HH105]|nr:hypothetical protein DUGA6_28180 [Duganella sp. HH105]